VGSRGTECTERASLGRNLIVTLSMCADTDTDIDLSVAWHLGALRLTVRDHSPGLPHHRPPAQEVHGRGLLFTSWSTRHNLPLRRRDVRP